MVGLAFDDMYFGRYDGLIAERAQLASAPEQLRQAEQAQQRVSQQVSFQTNTGQQARKKVEHYDKKIQKHENPTFWTKVTSCCHKGGVEGRLDRERVKLDDQQAVETKATAELQAANAESARAMETVSRLRVAASRLGPIDVETSQMRAAVVNGNQSALLAQLTACAASQQQQHDVDAVALARLREADAMVQAAQNDFSQAYQLEIMADRENERAQRDLMWDGAGAFERMDQRRRDRDMNAALVPARMGSGKLQQAFTMLPPAIYQKYPALAAGIGQVPIPNLEGQSFGQDLMMDRFGGDMGAMMSDIQAGGKIQRNMMVIQQCQQITSMQHGKIQALLAQFARDVDIQGQTLAQLQTQIAAEQDAIFNRLRAAVGSKAAQKAEVIKPMPVDNEKKSASVGFEDGF